MRDRQSEKKILFALTFQQDESLLHSCLLNPEYKEN